MDRPTKICVVSAGEEGANKDKERLIFQWIGRVDLFEDLYRFVCFPPPLSFSFLQAPSLLFARFRFHVLNSRLTSSLPSSRLTRSVVPEQAKFLPPPPSKSTANPNGDSSFSQLNGSSIASSQQPPPPIPTTPSNPPLTPRENEVAEEESESGSDEDEDSEEEEDDRNLCQSVSMEVGVTFVSWSITR